MTDAVGEEHLRHEGRCLGRYLASEEPRSLVLDHYVAVHRRDVRLRSGGDPLDRALSMAARTGRIGIVLADAYAGRFCRHGLLRRKLVLMTGLLECVGQHAESLDRPRGAAGISAGLRLAFRLVGELLFLLLSIPLFLPCHVAAIPGRRRTG